MPNTDETVLIVATGGTIAGLAASASEHVDYTAGALGAAELIAAVPPLAGQRLQALTLARLDSSDMDHATWHSLVDCLATQLARTDVVGAVVTHGTDTLEETAYFLHRVLAPTKPVVLTAAMRPATALSADGPQNLLDAVTVARRAGAQGVVAVLGGQVFSAQDLRKVHGYRLDAFSAGDAGRVGVVQAGQVRCFRAWPEATPHAAASRLPPAADWPRVDIVTSHAGASGAVVDALVASGVAGIVIAGTGNGSVHADLMQAAGRAQAAGVTVVRASRCALGGVVSGSDAHALPTFGALTAPQARIELMLDLLSAGALSAPGQRLPN